MAVAGIDNWEYARWVTVLGRSMRVNPAAPDSAQDNAAVAFVDYMLAKRHWLADELRGNSPRLQGLLTADNPQNTAKCIEVVGRDMMRTVVQDAAEKSAIDTLIAATGDRRYGAGATFGGAVGADVDQTP
jgi:hypothetical protein